MTNINLQAQPASPSVRINNFIVEALSATLLVLSGLLAFAAVTTV